MTRYGRSTPSVFDLQGRGEVDLTAGLGWTLSKSPALMAALWKRLGMPGNPADTAVALEVSGDLGRSDLELVGTDAKVIVEAKKGWLLPGESQLAKYVGHFEPASAHLLVSLSDSSTDWAASQLPSHVAGVPVMHVPWDDIRSDLRNAREMSRRPAERLWLDQLNTYLAGATAVRDPAEQWVFNVVLSDHVFGGRTFRSWVTDRRVYFHPSLGQGWPKRPPVLMGFRWRGRVHHVNRIVASNIYENLNDRFPEIDRSEDPGAHVVYDLGPDLTIPDLPTRGTYANARVWALLDQMLSQPTLRDAVVTSKVLTQSLE
jgi:hypothetical protein